MIRSRRGLRHLTFALCSFAILSTVRAADWYRYGDVQFPERRAITIANDTDATVNGFAVRVNLAELKVSPDAAGTAVVVDAEAKPALAGEAGGAMIPHQVPPRTNTLSFSISLPPRQKKTVWLYTTTQPINGVGLFAPQTSAHVLEAWRSFENNKTAFRIEVGPGAKTTGLTVDLFGKTAAGQKAGAILASQIYKCDYHKLQPWGIDILKVGSSPGLGGVYVIDGQAIGRTSAESTQFDILEEGPILTRVRAHGPVEINGRKLDVARTMTLTADDRGIDDVVEITLQPPPKEEKPSTAPSTKPAPTLDGLLVGMGLRNLPNETWAEDAKAGYALVDGDGNQDGTQHLGLGFAFIGEAFVRAQPIDDKVNGGKIFILKPTAGDKVLTSRHHLGGYWNGDGEVKSKEQMVKVLADWATILKQPPKVEIGKPEHK